MRNDPRRLRLLERPARRILRAIADQHPEIFDRLGTYAACRYLVVIEDAPFDMLLLLKERDIQIYSRAEKIKADATIRGNLLTLMRLMQGKDDGDALFFSRDISIGGNTEAVLALRNALDDADVDIIRDSLAAMGVWGSPLRFGYKTFKELKPIISGMFAP